MDQKLFKNFQNFNTHLSLVVLLALLVSCPQAHSYKCKDTFKPNKIKTKKFRNGQKTNTNQMVLKFKSILDDIKMMDLGYTKQSSVPGFIAQTHILTGKPIEDILPQFTVDYEIAGELNSVGNAFIAQTVLLSKKKEAEVVKIFNDLKEASSWSPKTPFHNAFVQMVILSGKPATEVLKAFESVAKPGSDTRQLYLALSAQASFQLRQSGATTKQYFQEFPYIRGVTSSTVRAIMIQTTIKMDTFDYLN